MTFLKIAATVATLAFATTAAFAQTAPVAPKAPVAATTAAPTAPAPTVAASKRKLPPAAANRTAESLACSAEADAQNIHGKANRPKFMAKCKKEKLAAKKS